MQPPPPSPLAAPLSTPRKDRRPTLTLKGDEFGVEFRALVNKAAERQGMTQAKWVAEVLTREAQRVVTGTPADNPALPVADDQRFAAVEQSIANLRAMVGKQPEAEAIIPAPAD